MDAHVYTRNQFIDFTSPNGTSLFTPNFATIWSEPDLKKASTIWGFLPKDVELLQLVLLLELHMALLRHREFNANIFGTRPATDKQKKIFNYEGSPIFYNNTHFRHCQRVQREITEHNSSKLWHTFGIKPDLKMHVQNLRFFPLQRGASKLRIFWRRWVTMKYVYPR